MSSLFNTKAIALAVGAATLALAGCDQATPPRAMPNTPHAAVAQASATGASATAQAPTMQKRHRAIKACMANGLSEATCAQVYHDMMAGRPPQGAATLPNARRSMARASAAATRCPLRAAPVACSCRWWRARRWARSAVICCRKSGPEGAYVPPTDWLKNRPSISARRRTGGGRGGRWCQEHQRLCASAGQLQHQCAESGGRGCKDCAVRRTRRRQAASRRHRSRSQGSAYSPQAPAANAPRYGSGNYAYKAPQTSRPGRAIWASALNQTNHRSPAARSRVRLHDGYSHLRM